MSSDDMDKMLADVARMEQEFQNAVARLDTDLQGDDPADLVAALSMERLLQHMDQTDGALNVLESRTDELLSKLDKILGDAEAGDAK
jgi:hypothetical protein